MSVVIDGTSGITTPAETVQGALTTTGNTILGNASTDTLNVGNGGLVKDASGNVGIGTASPESFGANTHSLTLDGTGSYNGVAWRSNGTVVALGYTNSTAGFILGTEGAIPLSLATNGTERMRIDSSGNVGIGTASPSEKLTVNGGNIKTDSDARQIGYWAADTVHDGYIVPYSATGKLEIVNSYVTGGIAFKTGNSKTEQATITPAGLFKFNSGYGSAATAYGCRAWVNFNAASGTFAGGTSTVTRIAASTTATITTTTPHLLTTGNSVWALTGVVAGDYIVTVLTATTFTITTVATTVLTAASITFAVNTIRGSGNVSSITDNGTGDYTVNFTTAMVDANYSVTSMAGGADTPIANAAIIHVKLTSGLTTGSVRFYITNSSGVGADRDYILINVHR